jgi:hypothetical protein
MIAPCKAGDVRFTSKADIRLTLRHVCFVPKGDIPIAARFSYFTGATA